MAPSPETMLRELQGDNTLKAWSVIITFFGDSIAPRGGAVSSTTVQTVMGNLGIEPGAVRTAFSRLAKDGWVTRQKVGRNTYYQLSKTGQIPFSKAEAIIYAGQTAEGTSQRTQWQLVTKSPHSVDDNLYRSAIKLNKDSFLFPTLSSQQFKDLSKDEALISTITNAPLPSWVINFISPDSIAAQYKRLKKIADSIKRHAPQDPLLCISLRTLLIHEWRRLLLPRAESNTNWLPADWPYEGCRQSVHDLYVALSPSAETWLDAIATGPNGALEPSAIDTLQRFG